MHKIFLPPPFDYIEPERVCDPCNRSLREKGLSERKPVGVQNGGNDLDAPAANEDFDSHY